MKIWKEGHMKIGIKDAEEIKSMREGGKILGLILHELGKNIQPGITGLELDAMAERMMKEHNVLPSFKGYHGTYPAVTCININHVVVHGIPNDQPLQDGDIVTIDCGVIHKKFHTDSAITKGVGKIDQELQKLIATAEKALKKAIETAKPGIRVRAISGVIQDIVEKNGYSIVRDLIGHGIGYNLHEDPQVPNFRDYEPGPILQPGMTIAIEPIFAMGSSRVKTLKDGWTIVTVDGSPAIQVEHTIAITDKGCEILTKRPDET
ncbi:MAG: type I methionyl aminopeptidase [Candidatus Gracilibacteria bacterium]